MDREKLIQRLMATFLGELEEHVRALNRELLALEQDSGAGRGELLITLFRTAHSLKGAARSVNVRPIEAACHHLESILGGARDGLRAIGPEAMQLLFTAADALKDAGERLRDQRDLADAPIQGLLRRLEASASGTERKSRAAPANPPATAQSEPPVPPGARVPGSAPPPAPDVQTRDGFMRVSADKLDTVLARTGELLVARRRAASRQEDVTSLYEAIQQSRTEWLKLEKPLRKLLQRSGHGNGAPSKPHDGADARAAPAVMLPKRALLAFERTSENFKRVERTLEQLVSRMASDQHMLEQVAAPLEESILRVRMLPFADACEGLARAVRDLAQAAGKEVELAIEGGGVELDRAVLEQLKDPLLHLVRNAIDHGIEAPHERLSRGKPARAKLTVAAALRGGGVEILVADDGRGLDLSKIRDQARRKEMSIPDDDREAAQLIFLPGFSTVRIITELSGRGVGLDVVKHRVESLHGHVDFAFEPAAGTRFMLTVPLTLTTLRALLLRAGGQIFALPVTSVRRLVRVGADDLASVEGREVFLSAGPPVPVVALAEVLGLANASVERSSAKVPLVVLASGERQVAFAVDELIAEQELVVKSLGARLRRVRNIAGATVLPTGRIALILSAAELTQQVGARVSGHTLTSALSEERPQAKRRVLVVDDSVTTRTLEKSILEAAGYEVLIAVNGSDAWQLLQERGADLVVADVEMPRMDGFGLCEAIRGSKRLRDLPVVLVTALESEKDKAHGLEVGADAYLPKSHFDQRQLLDTIAQLL